MTETGLPFTSEDIEDAIKHEGTLYDWMEQPSGIPNNKNDNTVDISGDYDMVKTDSNKY